MIDFLYERIRLTKRKQKKTFVFSFMDILHNRMSIPVVNVSPATANLECNSPMLTPVDNSRIVERTSARKSAAPRKRRTTTVRTEESQLLADRAALNSRLSALRRRLDPIGQASTGFESVSPSLPQANETTALETLAETASQVATQVLTTEEDAGFFEPPPVARRPLADVSQLRVQIPDINGNLPCVGPCVRMWQPSDHNGLDVEEKENKAPELYVSSQHSILSLSESLVAITTNASQQLPGSGSLSHPPIQGSHQQPSNTLGGGGGNTSNPPSAGKTQLCRWVFTLPQCISGRKVAEVAEVAGVLSDIAKEYYFQLEKAPTTGMLHYQGCLSLKDRQSFLQVKNVLPGGAHLEPCRDWFASIKYCQKEESRLDGPWSHLSPPGNKFPHQLMRANLYLWQVAVLGWLMQEPDNRTINWIYDLTGGNGKTAFALHMYDNHNAIIFNTGKDTDIAFAYSGQKIVIFDYMRSKMHVSYQVLEAMKNGYLFSGKYESKVKRFASPHILCLANWKPDFKQMSADRWKLYKLDNKELVSELITQTEPTDNEWPEYNANAQ